MNLSLHLNDPASSGPATLLVDAEAFGTPQQFSIFVTALDAVAPWPPRRARFAFSTLGWASDADLETWHAMGWGLIISKPRPTSLLNLCAVRRMAREGTLTIIPHA